MDLTTGIDDIIIQGTEAGIPSILIEVNERVSQARLQKLAQQIALWSYGFIDTAARSL